MILQSGQSPVHKDAYVNSIRKDIIPQDCARSLTDKLGALVQKLSVSSYVCKLSNTVIAIPNIIHYKKTEQFLRCFNVNRPFGNFESRYYKFKTNCYSCA